MSGQAFHHLRLNHFEKHVRTATLKEFQTLNNFCDVTLICEDKCILVHKIIISLRSTFFENILRSSNNQKPLIYLRGVEYKDLWSLIEFMYSGEITIDEEEFEGFLSLAEDFKIKGLYEDIRSKLTQRTKISINEEEPEPKRKCLKDIRNEGLKTKDLLKRKKLSEEDKNRLNQSFQTKLKKPNKFEGKPLNVEQNTKNINTNFPKLFESDTNKDLDIKKIYKFEGKPFNMKQNTEEYNINFPKLVESGKKKDIDIKKYHYREDKENVRVSSSVKAQKSKKVELEDNKNHIIQTFESDKNKYLDNKKNHQRYPGKSIGISSDKTSKQSKKLENEEAKENTDRTSSNTIKNNPFKKSETLTTTQYFNNNGTPIACDTKNCETKGRNSEVVRKPEISLHTKASFKNENDIKRMSDTKNKSVQSPFVGGTRYPCNECAYKATTKFFLISHFEKVHKGKRNTRKTLW